MNEKPYEKSCGAVVYVVGSGTIKYLLVRSIAGVWGFPKGHTELGESEKQTAVREIKEETALDVLLIDGFRVVDEYELPNCNKQVVYFLAEPNDLSFKPQEAEIAEIALVDFNTARSLMQFESSRCVLAEANDFLLNSYIID